MGKEVKRLTIYTVIFIGLVLLLYQSHIDNYPSTSAEGKAVLSLSEQKNTNVLSNILNSVNKFLRSPLDFGLKSPQEPLALININSCQPLSSGNTYTLTADISSSGDCFTINGLNNVVIDGNGFTITASGNALRLTGHASDIWLKNAIINANTGVRIAGGPYSSCSTSSAERINIQDNIFVNGGIAIGEGGASTGCHILIKDNIFQSSGVGLANYQFAGLLNATVINNYIADGLSVENFGNSLIMNNRIYKSTSSGLVGSFKGNEDPNIRVKMTFINNTLIANNALTCGDEIVWFRHIQFSIIDKNYIENSNTGCARKIGTIIYGANFSNFTNNIFKQNNLNPDSSASEALRIRSSSRNNYFINNTIINQEAGHSSAAMSHFGNQCCQETGSGVLYSPCNPPDPPGNNPAGWNGKCYSSNNVFDSNTLVGTNNGFWIYADGSGNLFRNNIIIGGITADDCLSTVTLYNNVIDGENGVSLLRGGCSIDARNNIFYTTGTSSISGSSSFTGDYNLFFPIYSALSGQPNSINGQDPQFINPAANPIFDSNYNLLRNYRLQSTSPAKDAGDPTTQVPVDKDGNVRPNGLRQDMGAYEIGISSAIPISGCQDINSPGVYAIQNDISTSNAYCISVTSSNVEIDGYNPTLNRKFIITLNGGIDCGGMGQCAVNTGTSSGINNVTIKNIESNSGVRSYWITNNLSVINSKFNGGGITIYAGDDFLLKDSFITSLGIHGRGLDCVSASDANMPYRFKLINNTLSGTGRQEFEIIGLECNVLPSNPKFNVNALLENNTITSSYYSTTDRTNTLFYILHNVQNITFRNNKFIARSIYSIFMRDGADDHTFIGNYFESDNSERGALHFASGNDPPNYASGNKFINNTFKGLNTDSMLLQAAGENNYFESNLFYAGAPSSTYGTNNLVKGINTTFIHNTFYVLQTNGYALTLDSNSNTFKYNIIAAANSNNMYNCITSSATYTGDYNIFYGTGTLNYCGNNLAGWRTTTGNDTGSIEANPLFVNVAAGNYQLQSTSPACNIGGSYAGAYPCAEEPVNPICSDTDSGINYNVQGTVAIVGNPITYTDYCNADGITLNEYYCLTSQATSPSISTTPCQYGCSNGRCNADVIAPVITNIQSTQITQNSATITWTTDESSSSLVKYGTISGIYPTQATGASGTIHSVPLTGLSASTPYYYVVNSTDAAGNSAQSTEGSFITSSPSPTNVIFTNPTPLNNSVLNNNNVTLNVSITSSSGLNKVNLKINGNNYTVPNLMGCHYENTYNCDNSVIGSGSGTTFSPGIFGLGTLIDGTDSLTYPSANNINQNEGTVMFWINNNGWLTSTGYVLLDSYSDTIATGLFVWKPTNTDSIRPVIYTDIGPFSINYPSTSLLQGTWHHIAVTYGNGNFSMYLDGYPVNSTSYTGLITAFNTNIYVGSRRTLVLQANSVFDEFKTYSKRLSPEEISRVYNAESGLYYIKLNNLPQGAYVINATVQDTNNVNTVSETRMFTINFVVPDTQAPLYSGIIQPQQPINYTRLGNYTFNITWTDNSALNTAWIEHNFNGVLRNVTVNTKIGNQYYFNVSDIAVGNYLYRWYANDSSGNLNKTIPASFNIDKATPRCLLSFLPSFVLYFPNLMNATGRCTTSANIMEYSLTNPYFNLYRTDANGVLMNADNENSKYVLLNPGYYTYIVNVSDTYNFTYSSADWGALILKTLNPVYLSLNGVSNNVTILNNQTLNATASSSSGNFIMYRDGIDATNESGTNVNLPVGYYLYEVFSNGNQNYTVNDTGVSYYVNVTQLFTDTTAPSYSNIINPTSNVYAKNRTYYFNATWTDNSALNTVWIEHNFNGALRNATAISSTGGQYYFIVNDLAAGTYSYRWYANDTSGNTNQTSLQAFTLNKAIPICTLQSLPSTTVTFPGTINVTGSCLPSEVQSNLYRGGINVNNELGINVMLKAGTYNYVANISSSANYTNSSATLIVTVLKGKNSIKLLMNSASSNLTITDNQTINATVYSDSGNYNLYRNQQDITYLSGVETVLPIGLYVFFANSSGDENFTSNNTGPSLFVTVFSSACITNCDFSIVLNQGVNLISLPLILVDNSITSIFGPILSNVRSIYSYNTLTGWMVYYPNPEIPSTLSTIEPRRAYFVMMNNASSITINGNTNNLNGSYPLSSLNPGWNLIGVHNLTSRTVQQEIESYNVSQVWRLNATNAYERITDFNTQIQPGEGYWFYAQ